MKYLFVFEQGVFTAGVQASLQSVSVEDITSAIEVLAGDRRKMVISTSSTLPEILAMNLGQCFVRRCG